jgi:hypothetical protein
MTTNPFSSPAPSGSDRSSQDEAVTRWADRLGRKEANRHKRNDFLAALVLAGVVFSATTAPALFSSEAATSTPQKVACVEAGQRLAPWFKAEAERKAQVGLDERDDFNLLLTWFRNAQSQCASGQTARAVENFQAVEGLIAKRVEQHQPADEDE